MSYPSPFRLPARSGRRFVAGAVLLAVTCVASLGAAQSRRTIDECIAESTRAQMERAAGHLRSARDAANRCVDPRCPAVIRKDCDAWSNELTSAIPTILLRVRDPNGADVVATVTIDGQPVAIDGRPHEIDPGPRMVTVSAPGFANLETTFVAEEGAHGRVIEVHLERDTRTTVAPVAARSGLEPPASGSSGSSTSTRPSTATWVVSGGLAVLGIAGLATFAVLGLDADADFRRLRDGCGSACARADTDSVRDRFQVADVALAVGLVGLAAAAVVYFVGPRNVPRQPAAAFARGPGRGSKW